MVYKKWDSKLLIFSKVLKKFLGYKSIKIGYHLWVQSLFDWNLFVSVSHALKIKYMVQIILIAMFMDNSNDNLTGRSTVLIRN